MRKKAVAGLLVVAALTVAAATLLAGLRKAEANGHPQFMWEPIVLETCVRYPVDCDVIIVH